MKVSMRSLWAALLVGVGCFLSTSVEATAVSPQWTVASRVGTPGGGEPFRVYSHPERPDYRLRWKSPKICDPDVKQYSGYLDISETRHLFFWFFEARDSPEEAPLVMWLNGGPGCSSLTGAFFELGPCSVSEGGNATLYNPYSWNQYANMIFLDQPIGTGFSYASYDSKIDTLAHMSEDVYAFLQLFLAQYRQYAAAQFHLAAESWGGHCAPTIANLVHKKNKEILYAPRPGIQHINLASVIVANGLTDPTIQFGSIWDTPVAVARHVLRTSRAAPNA